MDKRQQYGSYLDFINPQPEEEQLLPVPGEVLPEPASAPAAPAPAPATSAPQGQFPPGPAEQAPPTSGNESTGVDYQGLGASARAETLGSVAPGMVRSAGKLGKGRYADAYTQMASPMVKTGMLKAEEEQIAGTKREETARAMGEAAAREQEAFQQGMEERKRIAAEREARKEKNRIDYQNRVQSIMREPNPARFMNSATTGQKIGLAAAALLGGWVKHETGGSNPALDIIYKAIDDDIASQKDLLARQERGLQYAKEGYAMEDDIFVDRLEQNTLDKADKLAAGLAIYKQAVANIDIEAAPAETRNRIQQVGAALEKDLATLGVQLTEAKAKDDERKAAIWRQQQQAKAKQQADAQKNALYAAAVKGGEVPVLDAKGNQAVGSDGKPLMRDARDAYVSLYGAEGDVEIAKGRDALQKQSDYGREDLNLVVKLPTKGGKGIVLGRGVDKEAARDIAAKASSIRSMAKASGELQEIMARNPEWSSWNALVDAASRVGDNDAKRAIQLMYSIQQTAGRETDYEESGQGLTMMVKELGFDDRSLAQATSPEVLENNIKLKTIGFQDYLGAGRVVYGDEAAALKDIEDWSKDTINLASPRVTSAAGLATATQGEAAKTAAGAKLMGGWDKQSPESRAEAEQYLGAALSAFVSDPTNEVNKNAAKNAVDMYRDTGFSRASFKRAAEIAAEDLASSGRTGVFEATSGGESAGKSNVRGGGWVNNTRASDAIKQIADWYDMTDEQVIRFLNKSKGLSE